MKNYLKKIAVVSGILIVGCILILCFGAPNYDATYTSTDVPVTITVRVRQSNPILEEYSRTLIVETGIDRTEHKMLADSGGFSDANLFALGAGQYYIEGPFDAYRIVSSSLEILKVKREREKTAQYLGTFTFDKPSKSGYRGNWVYLDADKAPYRDLAPADL